jgi:hypothetical protein
MQFQLTAAKILGGGTGENVTLFFLGGVVAFRLSSVLTFLVLVS